MSADLESLASALLAKCLIDSKEYKELKDDSQSLDDRAAKLTELVKSKRDKGYRDDVMKVLEATKEHLGQSLAHKSVKEAVEAGQASSRELMTLAHLYIGPVYCPYCNNYR